MTEMNYKQETLKLQEAGERLEWFKPEEGKYKIKILDVGEEYQIQWDGKDFLKRRFTIRTPSINEDLNWGVTVGKTSQSLYGQLMKVGELKGKLEGETITLFVKGKKKDTSYTIEEAIVNSNEEAKASSPSSSLENEKKESSYNHMFGQGRSSQ